MTEISMEMLVQRLKERRGGRGIRETAGHIGISAATLSRVERGNLPDLETFQRICAWLKVDPGEVLGFRQAAAARKPEVRVHFKKESTMKPETAKALAELILVAQAEMLKEEGLR